MNTGGRSTVTTGDNPTSANRDLLVDGELYLSVVVPAFNEEHRLPATLATMVDYLDNQGYPYEIIVVDDGSDDNTVTVVRDLMRSHSSLRVIGQTHRGKASAVRAGFEAATGRHVLFSDADLSTPIESLGRFFDRLCAGYDIVIGSREILSARRNSEPWYRHVMGRVFNRVVRLVSVQGIQDTQCGFKLFTIDSAREIFPRLRIHQGSRTVRGPRVTAFDVEVLFLAQKLGFKIAEEPVDWTHVPGSKVRPAVDAFRMLVDVARVPIGWHLGKYN